MSIVVFGGTGSVGKIIVEKLDKAGKKVTVPTRQKKAATNNIKYRVANVLDYDAVENCIDEGDQVIISLGFNNSDLDTMSRGTKNIINAMKVKKSDRLICLSAYGTSESWNYLPKEVQDMINDLPLLKASFDDHAVQEGYIKSSKLNWTIVRPTEIIDNEEVGVYLKDELADTSTLKISKYDVAQFMIDELHSKNFQEKVVMITN